MKIIFSTYKNEDLYEELFRQCSGLVHGLNCVEVRDCSILDIQCDAVVSPSNSFGFMNGGIDLLYLKRFGMDLQYRLQKKIKDKHFGELLVGQAEIIETYHGLLLHLP